MEPTGIVVAMLQMTISTKLSASIYHTRISHKSYCLACHRSCHPTCFPGQVAVVLKSLFPQFC